MNTTTTKIAGEAMTDEHATFKEFRAALCRMNDANTPVSVADRVMILSNATFLLDEYERAASPTPASPSGEDAAEQAGEAVTDLATQIRRLRKDENRGDMVFRYGFNAALDSVLKLLDAARAKEPK